MLALVPARQRTEILHHGFKEQRLRVQREKLFLKFTCESEIPFSIQQASYRRHNNRSGALVLLQTLGDLTISYTVFFRTFTGFLPNIQVFFRTRRFPLDCSMSYPIRSSVHRNGTYPILKTFLQYLRYRRFEGVEAPEGCENVA